MNDRPKQSGTQLLTSAECGDPSAAVRLLNLVYEDLRCLAHQQMRQERADQTLTATALVHEAYLRLIGDDASDDADTSWHHRGHFFAAAARAMRRILVERARRRRSKRHGGGRERRPLDSGVVIVDPPSDEILDLDEALCRLEQRDARKAEIVSLRYFAGLSIEQTAYAMRISPRLVNNEWHFARA